MLLTYGKKSSYMWKGKTGVWARSDLRRNGE